MFTTKGPVDPENFIGRQELAKAKEYLNSRDYTTLLGARQTGKTSLLIKLQHSLKKDYYFVYLDCQGLYNQGPIECYEYICSNVEKTLGIVVDSQLRSVKSGVDFFQFLKNVLDQKGDRPIVIMLDEIGALTQESINSLANSIRFIFHRSNGDFTLERPLLFVLSGATDILELATSKTSPLRNVVSTIYMYDLNQDETRQLLDRGFGQEIRIASEVADEIYKETHGHPYLVQRVGDILENVLEERDSNQLTVELVETAIQEILRGDVNLEHINNLLRRDTTVVLETLREIYVGAYKGRFNRIDPILARLELIGVIREDNQGNCVIRNRIYERVLETQLDVEPAVGRGEEIEAEERPERGIWLRGVRVFVPMFAAFILIFSVIWLGTTYLLPQEHEYETTSLPPLAISVRYHQYVSVGDQEEISITATNIGTATITNTTIILSYAGTPPIPVTFEESNAVNFSELKSGETRTQAIRMLVNQLDKDLLKQAQGRGTIDFDLLVAYDDKTTPKKIESCQVKILQIFRLRWVLTTALAGLLIPFLRWIGKELWKWLGAAF